MGRLHTHNHGKSHSIRPIDPKKPDWITQSTTEIEEMIVKYSKDGMTTSQIGIKLRDQHAIPLVKPIIKKQWIKAYARNYNKIRENEGFYPLP